MLNFLLQYLYVVLHSHSKMNSFLSVVSPQVGTSQERYFLQSSKGLCYCVVTWGYYKPECKHNCIDYKKIQGSFSIHYIWQTTIFLDNNKLRSLWQKLGKGPFSFQHDSAPLHKGRSMRKMCHCVVKLWSPAQSPDLNPSQHLWYELWTRPYRPSSVLDFSNALVVEWEQIPAARFRILVESLLTRVDAVSSSIVMPDALELYDQQSHECKYVVSTLFWLLCVLTMMSVSTND